MSFFFNKNKNLSDHRLMERYRGDIDGCSIVGETSEYTIYIKNDSIFSEGHFLRQEKSNPKKVVYLGEAHFNRVVLNNLIFSINHSGIRNSNINPLFITDINTGERSVLNILSDKTYREYVKGKCAKIYSICQDKVSRIRIENDSVVLDISRYNEGVTVDILNEDMNSYLKFKYCIYIKQSETGYLISKNYPKNTEA